MRFDLPDALNELKALRNWVAWRAVPDKDNSARVKKVPINPETGFYASPSNHNTWSSFDKAITATLELGRNAHELHKDYGIGFMFGEMPCGYGGIDIDDCVNDDGSLSEIAASIVAIMDSYTEYSPSGKGLHILFKLDAPLSQIGSRNRNDSIGLEIYDCRRYLTITGRVYGDVKPLTLCTEKVRQVYSRFMPKGTQKQNAGYQQSSYSDTTDNLTDAELWQLMFNSEMGAKIKRLYNGDTSDYGNDDSRADEGMCCYLAFWTFGNGPRIDRMFRQSGLMRDKWERQDYREATIARAIAETPNPETLGKGYNPPNCDNNSENNSGRQSGNQKDTGQDTGNEHFNTMLDYLNISYQSDIERFSSCLDLETGYFNMDNDNLKLYNGLYVLGAVSGLGKTTFAHQMADQIAKAGHKVLYISLEQSALEFATKAISRLTAIECIGYIQDYPIAEARAKKAHENADLYPNADTISRANDREAEAEEILHRISAVSAINIRRGKETPAIKKAVEKYKTFAGNQTVIECGFGTTIDQIVSTVGGIVRSCSEHHVVFVDYLQAISANDKKIPIMQATDCHVQALKKLSLELDLPVILISSFNRENYLSIVDFSSFKQSGGIEYTADVVWGFQLSGMNNKIYNTNNSLHLKRLFARHCMERSPRQVELVVLKNRYGRMGNRYFFDYWPMYDLFLPNNCDSTEIDAQMKADFTKFEAKFKADIEDTEGTKKTRNNSKPVNDKGEI